MLVRCLTPKGYLKEYYEVPIGEPDIKRDRVSDITILTIGATLYRASGSCRPIYMKMIMV
jgi:pyruvate/2-oxoglutarate/acetoin dehydrogenase E1 component